MAFTVQDNMGTVAGANAYIDVATMKSIRGDRELPGAPALVAPTANSQIAIIAATDYIDLVFQYAGVRLAAGQTTEFPRDKLFDDRGDAVTGIPDKIQEAVALLASKHINGIALLPDQDFNPAGAIKKTREKVDVLETEIEYATPEGGSATNRVPSFPEVVRLVQEYLGSSGSSQHFPDVA